MFLKFVSQVVPPNIRSTSLYYASSRLQNKGGAKCQVAKKSKKKPNWKANVAYIMFFNLHSVNNTLMAEIFTV